MPTHHHPHILIFSLSPSHYICRWFAGLHLPWLPFLAQGLVSISLFIFFVFPFLSFLCLFSFIWVKRLQLACKFIYFLLFSLLGFWWTLDLWSFCDPYCGLVWGFSFLLRNFCTHLKIYNLEWSSSKPFDFFFFFKCYISLTLFFLSENVSKCLCMLLEWNLWFGVSLFLLCFCFF